MCYYACCNMVTIAESHDELAVKTIFIAGLWTISVDW
jgi:hypothetical protein